MGQVTCLGILVADLVGRPIDHLPERGQLIGVDRIELHTGGCAANTAASLAKLGLRANIVGKVGHDSLGEFMVTSLEKNGVNMAGVVMEKGGATSATMVMVDSGGERSFIHCTGANATFGETDIRWEVIEAAPILHVAGPFLMTDFVGDQCANVLRRAKEIGKITTLDTVWDFTGRWMNVLKQSLPYLDYALPSLEEARALTGRDEPRDIAQVFLDAGVKTVGIKLGAEGSYLRTAEGDEIRAPRIEVNAIDSLGAGDAWSAGFLAGLVHGWNLEKCLRFANAVGACCVEALGATTGVRSFEDTCRLAFGAAYDATTLKI